MDLLRELKNMKMSLETLQVSQSTMNVIPSVRYLRRLSTLVTWNLEPI